jgi:hypothetical protein
MERGWPISNQEVALDLEETKVALRAAESIEAAALEAISEARAMGLQDVVLRGEQIFRLAARYSDQLRLRLECLSLVPNRDFN